MKAKLYQFANASLAITDPNEALDVVDRLATKAEARGWLPNPEG